MKLILKNYRGQSLVEYLVIVALMGVGSIAVMRIVGQVVNANFATIAHQLKGQESKAATAEVTKSSYKKRDLGDFFDGAAKSEK